MAGGGAYNWGGPGDTIRPFVSFGLGATHFSPEARVDSETRFSWSLGGGARFSLSDSLGLRLQGRWTPIYVNSDEFVFCDWWGYCYVASDAQYLYQTELSAGLSIGF